MILPDYTSPALPAEPSWLDPFSTLKVGNREGKQEDIGLADKILPANHAKGREKGIMEYKKLKKQSDSEKGDAIFRRTP